MPVVLRSTASDIIPGNQLKFGWAIVTGEDHAESQPKATSPLGNVVYRHSHDTPIYDMTSPPRLWASGRTITVRLLTQIELDNLVWTTKIPDTHPHLQDADCTSAKDDPYDRS